MTYLPELARLNFQEWASLRPEESLEGRTARLRSCCGHHELPTVVVAIDGQELVGSAMLVAHDMDSRPKLTPWLGGVFVKPEHRGKGVGSALVRRIESEALGLGFPSMYRYTPHTEGLYAQLGWPVMEHSVYLKCQRCRHVQESGRITIRPSGRQNRSAVSPPLNSSVQRQ